MRNKLRWYSLLKVVAVLWMALLFPANAQVAAAADPELDALRAKIEGVYALDEWQTESEVFRPPRLTVAFLCSTAPSSSFCTIA